MASAPGNSITKAPLPSAASDPSVSLAMREVRPSATALRVLLVERDENRHFHLRDMLDTRAFRLDWVSDYQFALNALQRRQHDIILLDDKLGDRSATDFLREAAARGCRAPIIVLTTHDELEFDRKILNAGAVDVLLRPQVTPPLLKRAIRHAIERRQAQEQIREQAQLLDLAQDAIMVCDLDHKVQFWNRGAETLYGWTIDETRGTDIARSLHQAGEDYDEARRAALENGEWSGEMAHHTKGHKPIVVNSRWSLVCDPQTEKPRSILIINTNITDRKRLDVQSLRAQRLESICNLSTGIAHDLNNVLSPVLMAVPLLRATVKDDKLTDLLDALEGSARRGSELVQQVLAFAQTGEDQTALLQIKHLVTKAAEITRRNIPGSIKVRFHADPDLWTIQGDAFQLEEMLLDLISNARDAMPDGGILTIRAENTEVDKETSRRHAAARVGEFVRIAIQDTGTGISKEHLKKIFNPFFTTKLAGRGSGLGLVDALDIAQSHRGFIIVNSESGKGSEFLVYLPKAETARIKRIDLRGEGIEQGKGEMILVVDDDELILKTTRATLETFGYKVETAFNGNEALEHIDDRKLVFDAVITDLRMPVMDGATLICELEKRQPNLVFITISGAMNADQDLGDAREQLSGRMMHIAKPYTSKMLLNKLRSLLDRHAKVN